MLGEGLGTPIVRSEIMEEIENVLEGSMLSLVSLAAEASSNEDKKFKSLNKVNSPLT